MNHRFLLTLPLPEPAPSLLAERGEIQLLGRIPTGDELGDALAEGPDALCCQLRDIIDDDVLDRAHPRLRAVCNFAVGYDNVDVDAASRRGIFVTNTPDVLTTATADCAMGLMLSAARRLTEGDAVVRAGRYDGWRPDYMLGLDLYGATLAVLGFGRIGQALAERALAFGMNVVYVDPGWPQPPTHLTATRPVELPEALAEADVLSIHLPLTPGTRHLVDADALAAMKSTAILVNTARGPIIDEVALVRALQEGQIAGAGLDVYEHEPALAPGLAECRTAVLAPHLGSATHRTRAAMARICAQNAIAATRGEVPPNTVNPEALRQPRRDPR
jgi:glyoxylate reductase